MTETIANSIAVILIIVSIILGINCVKNINSSKLSLLRTTQRLITSAVLLGTLSFTIHISLLIFWEIDEIITEQFFGPCAMGTVVLVISSFLFELCNTIKTSIIFNFLAKECVLLKDSTNFFDGWLDEVRIIMFVLGILFSYLLLTKAFKNNCELK